MAQGGLLGNGTKVAYSSSSPVSWTAIRQVVDVVFPTYVADDVNIDTHSTTNKLHRTMAGLISVGNASVTVLSDPDPATGTDQAFLNARNLDGTSIWLRIERPVNRARTSFYGIVFSCTVKSSQPATPIADKQTTVYEFQFDGDSIQVDAAAGASSIS
jgi:hypothetical protein